MNQVFNIDRPYNKFVVIVRQGKGEDETTTYILVTGPITKQHKQIALNYYHKNSGDSDYDDGVRWFVSGGGSMVIDSKTKTIEFSGKSHDFVPFEHSVVVKMAHKAMAEEGYEGWTLKVRSLFTILPSCYLGDYEGE